MSSTERGGQIPPVHAPPDSRRRKILRLAVPLGVTVTFLFVVGFKAQGHYRSASASPAPPACNCASPAGAVHHPVSRRQTEDAAPTVGPDDTFDVVVPEDRRFNAVRIAAGADEYFGTNIPLPSGPTPKEGGWTATFGQISRDGTHYRAPQAPPYGGLDWIQYHPPANADGVPIVELAVAIYADPNAPALADAPGDCTEGITVTAEEDLLTAAPNPIGPLLPEDTTLHAASDQAAPLTDASSPVQAAVRVRSTKREPGYLMPAWSDSPDLKMGIRKNNPTNPKKPPRQMPVICRQPGPLNPPPPFPPGQNHYACAVGLRGKYDVASDWQCGSLDIGSWKEFGDWKGDITASQSLEIKTIYNVKIDVVFHFEQKVKMRDTQQSCIMYTDHYECADNGKNWIYLGTTKCVKTGTGEIFLPAWLAYMEGYQPNGNVRFADPACTDIHQQPRIQ